MTDHVVMPYGVTPSGLPYPEDTDAVMLGAQAIKALAQAIDQRPWYHMVRWVTGTVGTAVDAQMYGWNLQETNYPASLEALDSSAGGFLCQLAGLYAVTIAQSFVSNPWTGGTVVTIGAKSGATPPREIGTQSVEVGYSGNQRRTFVASGLLRLAAGEWCRGVMTNGGQSGSLNYSGSAANADNDQCQRLDAVWLAP